MSDLISREALKTQIEELYPIDLFKIIEANGQVMTIYKLICNSPLVNPCENCDLYFKAMTKEEMQHDVQ